MKNVWKILLFLLFVSCTKGVEPEKPNSDLELERNALMALYDSAGGSQWLSAYKNSWGRGEVSNLWRGVFIDEQGYVFKLDLTNINMQGTLPEELGNLKHLKQCYLNSNKLTGKIPQSLSQNENFNNFIFGIIRQQNDCPGFDLTDIEYKLPEFIYKDINDREIKSSETWAKSKFTVVFSWNTTNQTSQQFVSVLKHLYEIYEAENMGVIGFSAENKQSLLNYCKVEDIKWTTIPDVDSYCSKKLMLDGITNAVIVDESGHVVLDNITDISTLKNFFSEKLGSAPYYTSTNYTYNGQKLTIQQSDRPNAVNILLMGDGFVDRDMNQNGKWEQAMRKATEHLFSIEPGKSYRNYFNVYAIKVVSENEVFVADSRTAFSVAFGDGTIIEGNDQLCKKYAESAGLAFEKTLITIVVNSPRYAGTCYLYNNGGAIAYVPMTEKNSNTGGMDFQRVLLHEAIGHGFSKLSDEYIYYYTSITDQYKTEFLDGQSIYKMGFNMTLDKNDVPWQHFIGLTGYQMVGLYEGGYFFSKGIWRAEQNQCMNNNVLYFNAPSRELFVKRVKKLAGESYSFQEFIANDKYEPVIGSRNSGTDNFIPLHPPVHVK